MEGTTTLAQAVVRDLAGWGVPVVFGVAGDDVLPLLDALATEGAPRYLAATHEANAAFMAAAWGALTGQPGVCVAGAAGAVNLLEGLAGAALDRSPVVALTGQLATPKLGTRAKQYLNQQRLLSEIALESELVADAQAGIRLLHRALSQAWLGRGVTHLSVPHDLWRRPVDARPCARPALLGAGGPGPSGAVRGDVERAASLVRRSRRPLLILGREAAGAEEAVRRLAAAWGAAVVVAQDARGVVDEAWPAVVGGIGEGWLPPLVGASDGVVLVGTASFEEGYLSGAPVVQVAAEPESIAPEYLWDSLVGDPAAVLAGLAAAVEGTLPDPVWQEQAAAARREWDQLRAADLGRNDHPVHPARLMAELDRVLSPDAVVALDEGAFNHWFERDFRAARHRVLISAWWRNMGAGLPGALAAALAFPGRQTVVVTGDGGLLMTHGELVTAVRYGLAVKVIVARNGAYGLERDKAAQASLNPVGLELQAPDFRRYAESCGVAGFRVEDPADVGPALARAFALPGPALVEVVCADVRLPFPAPSG